MLALSYPLSFSVWRYVFRSYQTFLYKIIIMDATDSFSWSCVSQINYCYILKQFEHDRGKTGIQFSFSSPTPM